MESKCNKPFGNLKSVQIINMSDCVYEDGKVRIKRKYSKFKREVYNLDLNDLKEVDTELSFTIKKENEIQ